MRTTLLNPVVCLLTATVVAAIAGAVRGRSARQVVAGVLRWACALPVLAMLSVMSVAGLGSRAVLGYLSPGAYAEEVLAARTYVAERRLYPSNAREELSAWMSEQPRAMPWSAIPGISPCQANALTNRARFFTEHAHPPMLLLAAVPVVATAGGRGLYLLIVVLSLASIGALAAILVDTTSAGWRSRQAVLALVTVAGWQPVLAAVRQGDAALAAAALVAVAWYVCERRAVASGIAAGVAACICPPAIGAVPALFRVRRAAAGAASAAILLAIGVTTAIAGSSVLTDFFQTVRESVATYADATANYAVAVRFARGAGATAFALVVVGVVACSWWAARTRDEAFALLLTAGLLSAPMLWSQHLAIVFVPAVVLFGAVVRGGSPLALAAWAALALTFSLPDTAVIAIARWLAPVAGPVPVAAVGLSSLWIWMLLVLRRASAVRGRTAAAAVVAS